jgi:hypothetical protein
MAANADLSPHPLVTAIGASLGATGTPLDTARNTLSNATPPPRAAPRPNDEFTGKRTWAEAQGLADALAQDSNVPELVAFAGCVGGNLNDPPGTFWRLLYLDMKLLTWLLIEEDKILFRDTLRDDTMPFRERDVIWLRRDTPVSHGMGAPQPGEVQARQLRGEFTAAGDFKPALGGGTASTPPTGPWCTPLCCGKHTG